MASPAPGSPPDLGARPPVRLGLQERAVLSALVQHHHHVIGRRELAELSGLDGLSARRCDSVLVQLRRALGAGAITTVRSRGWRLQDTSLRAARSLLT